MKTVKKDCAVEAGIDESVYGVEEIARVAESKFNAPRDCVEAAFRAAGKHCATLIEARKIIRDFMCKKVKG